MSMHAGNSVLVTGGGTGIGRAAARLFASEGGRVAVCDRNAETAGETVRAIEEAGGEALFIEVDVADPDSVRRMVETAAREFGRLDAAFNNAGINHPAYPFHEMKAELWQEMLDVNLSGVFWCMQQEIRQMLAQEPREGRRGAIVNTSSGAAIVPAPGAPHYTAAKHGVVGITKVAAQEYMDRGIRCNSVLPGVIDTPMAQGALAGGSEEYRKTLMATLPQGRLGKPEEVAELAVWLASARAGWINGESVQVNGGGVIR